MTQTNQTFLLIGFIIGIILAFAILYFTTTTLILENRQLKLENSQIKQIISKDNDSGT